MNNVHHNIPPNISKIIDDRLNSIEEQNDVRILLAVESGSRAWGFPSPDSDFDVRFIYAHRPCWYLSIDPRRDVIELPIEGDLDINGWDLRKALQLLMKSNPVLLEWLRSPIIYRANHQVLNKIATLGRRAEHRRPTTYHYLRIAETQYQRFIAGKERVALKKYFYSLRPALALIWIRNLPDEPVPMALPELVAGIHLSPEVSRVIRSLIERKSRTRELGDGPRIDVLDKLIMSEIEFTRHNLDKLPVLGHEILDAANELFRDIVNKKL